MAIATKPKPTQKHDKKRVAAHHRQNKHYIKSYWPYLPMAAVVGLGIIINGLLGSPQAVLGAQSDISPAALLRVTNQDRSAQKLSSLGLDSQLTAAAQAKADDMVGKGYWSHVTPSGQQPWNFMTTAGYQYQTAGENLAYGFDSASDTLSAWMQSPQHRANVLNASYADVGFGIAQSTNFLTKGPETVVVAMYGSPVGSMAIGHLATSAPTGSHSVTRFSTVAASAGGGLVVGIVGGGALMLVLLRHGLAWRRFIKRGETLVLKHPLLDCALVTLAVTGLVLSRSAGFIQ